jgi:hypothetical protein
VLLLDRATGIEHTVRVEVVDTPEARRVGLMHRRELAADAGMLFVFPHQEHLSFWMKNTLIPLDMIFIDEAMNVAGVVHEAEPGTLTPRAVDAPSRFVLEVRGGWAAPRGVDAGDRARFTGVDVGG